MIYDHHYSNRLRFLANAANYLLTIIFLSTDKIHIEKEFNGVRALSAKVVRFITDLNAEFDAQEQNIETSEGVEVIPLK